MDVFFIGHPILSEDLDKVIQGSRGRDDRMNEVATGHPPIESAARA